MKRSDVTRVPSGISMSTGPSTIIGPPSTMRIRRARSRLRGASFVIVLIPSLVVPGVTPDYPGY